MLQPHFMCDYDLTQSIGRRYRRQDEVGTPWCVTVDFDSLEDDAVTVRDRDTTEQVRVPIDGPRGRAAPAHRAGVGGAVRPAPGAGGQATRRYLRTARGTKRISRPAHQASACQMADGVGQRAPHHQRAARR